MEDKNRISDQRQQIENSMNMVDINPAISVISLKVNDLNVPVKIQKLSKWVKNHDRTICYLRKRVDFKVKNVIRDKEGHYIMIKESFFPDDVTILTHMHLTMKHQTM